MKNQFSIIAAAVAIVVVVVVAALSMTATPDTKRAISENIPHGSNEKPIKK